METFSSDAEHWAAQSAAKGNPAEMVRMVNQLMQSPDGAALIDRINKTMNGR